MTDTALAIEVGRAMEDSADGGAPVDGDEGRFWFGVSELLMAILTHGKVRYDWPRTDRHPLLDALAGKFPSKEHPVWNFVAFGDEAIKFDGKEMLEAP